MAAYTTVNDPTIYMNPLPYTGTEVTLSITGVGFQPDLVWLKKRGNTSSHWWTDVIRGVTETLYSNATTAETTESEGLTAFGADGFTLGDDYDINQEDQTQMSWNWKANGAGSSNGDGAETTTVSVDTTAGFSIVKYDGTGTNTNFGHGLGVAPNVILVKSTTGAHDWVLNGDFLGSTTWQHKLILNSNAAKATADNFDDTKPTASVFYLNGGHSTVNGSGETYIAYCFAEKQGYGKFGTYTGNGNDDGPFVYTGFRPAWTMIKLTSGTDYWVVDDNKRSTSNIMQNTLNPDRTAAEYTGSAYGIDFLSNGFKVRNDDGQYNNSGGTYVYMAFAEQPFVNSEGVPCNAR